MENQESIEFKPVVLCHFGCGQEAKFFNRKGEGRCCFNHLACPVKKQKLKDNYEEIECPKCHKKLGGNKGSHDSHIRNCDGTGTKIDRKSDPSPHICPKCNYYIQCRVERHIELCDGKGPRRVRQKLYPGKKGGWNKGMTANTNKSLKEAGEKLKQKYSKGELVPSFTGKKHSKISKEKISDAQRRYYKEHPEKIPYLINHSSRESYPEKYFREVFEKENIPLKQYLQVGLYELDFYNEELKIDIEIDGQTHEQQKVKEIDNRKDKFLKSLGWKVHRIKWSNWQKKTREEKELSVKEIKKLVVDGFEPPTPKISVSYSNQTELHDCKDNAS